MSKPIHKNLLNVAAIAGLLDIVSFGMFYLARNNLKSETVPSGVLSLDYSTRKER